MSKYNETMEHLELSPKVENRILARLREEQALMGEGSSDATTSAKGLAAAAGAAALPNQDEVAKAGHTAAEAVKQAATEASGQASTEAAAQTSTATSGQTSTEAAAKTSTEAVGQAAGEASGQTATETSGQAAGAGYSTKPTHVFHRAAHKAASHYSRIYKIAATCVAAVVVVVVLAGQGLLGPLGPNKSSPDKSKPKNQTAVIDNNKGGNDDSSGTSSDQKTIELPNEDNTAGTGSSNILGAGDSNANSGSSSTASSGSSSTTKKDSNSSSSKTDKSGSKAENTSEEDSSASDADNNADEDSDVQEDTNQPQRELITVSSIADQSDVLARVTILSKEGPDADGFYTFRAEITDVVYGCIGKEDKKEMVVCLYDDGCMPSLEAGDHAYFFLSRVGSDEFYITEENAGVVKIQDGEVVFAEGVTVTGYRQDTNVRMRESDFVRSMN
ncbi:MAG: hypothetical protein ACOYJJ_04470 [Anaerovoracaceae bacterium]